MRLASAGLKRVTRTRVCCMTRICFSVLVVLSSRTKMASSPVSAAACISASITASCGRHQSRKQQAVFPSVAANTSRRRPQSSCYSC